MAGFLAGVPVLNGGLGTEQDLVHVRHTAGEAGAVEIATVVVTSGVNVSPAVA